MKSWCKQTWVQAFKQLTDAHTHVHACISTAQYYTQTHTYMEPVPLLHIAIIRMWDHPLLPQRLQPAGTTLYMWPGREEAGLKDALCQHVSACLTSQHIVRHFIPLVFRKRKLTQASLVNQKSLLKISVQRDCTCLITTLKCINNMQLLLKTHESNYM